MEEEALEIQLAARKEPSEDGHLTVDVFKSEDNMIVQSTIAGTAPEDIDVSITKEMVTIRGRRIQQEKVKTSDYYHQELYWGSFSRSIILPVDIDPDKAKASIKNGVLTIKMPIFEK